MNILRVSVMPDVQTATTTTSEILLEGIIDYAGLYPPADLDMKTVVKNWSLFLQSDDSWILARLIIPSSRLQEFKDCAKLLLPSPEEQDLWQLSVLLPPAGSEQFESAVQATIDFNVEDCGAVANVVEFKATTAQEIDSALEILHDDLFPFIELPIEDDPRGLIAALSGVIAGAKVRTGGVSSDLYPTTENLARFIHSCAIAGQPFKATAGMHHPCRNKNESVGVTEFGFLSVLHATAAASIENKSVSDLENILTMESPDFTSFSDTNLEQVRAELFNSVGSCSFDDPRTDLRSMGLLKD